MLGTMLRPLRVLGRLLASQSIAVLALCVALSGTTAYAVAMIAPKNTVVSSSIRNGQVKRVDLGRAAVGARKIAAGAVRGKKIAPGAVTTASLAYGAVDAGRIARDVVDGGHVRDGSLTGSDLDADSVTGEHVDESTLGTVPSATVGGYGASGTTTCTPGAATQGCGRAYLAMPVPGQVLAQARLELVAPQGTQIECWLSVGATEVDRVVIEQATDVTVLRTPLLGLAPPKQGSQQVGVDCRRTVGGSAVVKAFVAAVALGTPPA